MPLSKEDAERILAELNRRFVERGKKATCPYCGNQNFVLSEGYTHRNLSNVKTQPVLGGISIPSVTIICTYCGHISDFALGVLGLLQDKPEGQPVIDLPPDGIRIIREVKE